MGNRRVRLSVEQPITADDQEIERGEYDGEERIIEWFVLGKRQRRSEFFLEFPIGQPGESMQLEVTQHVNSG